MQGHLIDGLLVDTFNDINLAVGRPALADSPKGRPHTTGRSGHVGKVGNQQAMIEIHIRLDASRGPATRAVGVGVVDAKIDVARLDVGQPRAVGGVIVDIFNKPEESACINVFPAGQHTRE